MKQEVDEYVARLRRAEQNQKNSSTQDSTDQLLSEQGGGRAVNRSLELASESSSTFSSPEPKRKEPPKLVSKNDFVARSSANLLDMVNKDDNRPNIRKVQLFTF